ncbi:hypothetical protein [Brevundimonas sp. NIBR11]|uniref:hypothetical protein n=1 Tax=Brevundimonas sp. NIBR11 TaxID=3015999 RepID=UPI0022F0851B|nr:hypothetical protein [Brevundimonas sp. NIBR11]WGM30243.1 hypothetical protein KKHFBJBL_00459 [Brevundimonas sp. NIBR11]
MPHRAPRILTLLTATAGACLLATGATAQNTTGAAPAAGRYLTWANRPADTTPADVVAAQARVRNGMIPRRMAPSQGYNRPAMQAPVSAIAVSRGLTPASAWIGPRVAPSYAPGSPDPIAYATTEVAAPAPVYSPPAALVAPAPAAPPPVTGAAVDPMAPRRDAPVFSVPQSVQAPTVQPQASQPVAADPGDPNAPRRDALIFQVQQGQTGAQAQQQAALSAPTQGAPNQAPVQSGQPGARYYSVHRDAGHRPDPTTLPEPVYFDSVSVDLAAQQQPADDEVPARDARGRRRVVANEDPSLP